MKKFYRRPPPGIDASKLSGMLIVVEGMDSSGRSTQISLLTPWLEQKGYAVAQVALKRSQLVGEALEEAKQGNVLSARTMSLFYATDFYDQLENRIISALRAGYIVLADRYIFTLMARDIIRGADEEWVRSLYSMAVVPEAVYYLSSSWRTLANRTLLAHATLDYWESGMDLGLSRDWFDSFASYQRRMSLQFKRLQSIYKFEMINANRPVGAVNKELRMRIELLLENYYGKTKR